MAAANTNYFAERAPNVPAETFKQWQALQRWWDKRLISKEIKLSVPVVHAALTYGYIYRTHYIEAITKFFTDRAERERKAAEDLTTAPPVNQTTE